MTKNPHHPTIARSDLTNLLFNTISDLRISDLGWWLECKTDNEYTVIEYEFLRETFALLDNINAMNSDFKAKWLNSLDTIKARGLK